MASDSLCQSIYPLGVFPNAVLVDPSVSGSLALRGSSSGTLTLAAPAAAGTNTLTFPAGTTDFSATGGTSQLLRQASAGSALTVTKPDIADITAGARHFSNPGNPAVTASTAVQVMMGLGSTVSVTPTKTGALLVDWSCFCVNDTVLDGGTVGLSYGTGTAPANGDALIGTAVAGNRQFTSAIANAKVPASGAALIVGLMVNTAHWFDLRLSATTGGNAGILVPTFRITEIS